MAKKAKAPTYFQERKDFIARMVGKPAGGSYGREMGFTKKIFALHDVAFLVTVKPPFEGMNSLAYFISGDGKRYLEIKAKEFLYKAPKCAMVIEEEKTGEDWKGKKKKSIRGFLK